MSDPSLVLLLFGSEQKYLVGKFWLVVTEKTYRTSEIWSRAQKARAALRWK